jgi:hypothetical protein
MTVGPPGLRMRLVNKLVVLAQAIRSSTEVPSKGTRDKGKSNFDRAALAPEGGTTLGTELEGPDVGLPLPHRQIRSLRGPMASRSRARRWCSRACYDAARVRRRPPFRAILAQMASMHAMVASFRSLILARFSRMVDASRRIRAASRRRCSACSRRSSDGVVATSGIESRTAVRSGSESDRTASAVPLRFKSPYQ